MILLKLSSHCFDCFPVEVGHNWGSYHDLDTAECNPPFVENGGQGKYVMYPSVLTGIEPNNKVGTMEEFYGTLTYCKYHSGFF